MPEPIAPTGQEPHLIFPAPAAPVQPPVPNIPTPVPQPQATPPASPSTPSTPALAPAPAATPKKHTKLKIFVVALCLLFWLMVGLWVKVTLQLQTEKPKVETEMTKFLQEVSVGDATSAYNKTSPKFKEATTFAEFSELFTSQRAFSGFKHTTTGAYKYSTNIGRPDSFAYRGVITFDDGDVGEVTAVLEKNNGMWQIYGVNLSVKPERIRKFSQ